jgi:hypothetical protein
MITLVICLLVGLVLGQRFRVLALIPYSLLVIALTLTVGLVSGSAFWPTAGRAVAAMASLQMGYLLGLGVHALLLGHRKQASESNTLKARTPARGPAH